MSYSNFKTFEELEQSIKRAGEKWQSEHAKADTSTMYKHKWAELISLDTFVKNERAKLRTELKDMRNKYADRYVIDKERELNSELDAFIKRATDNVKDNIKALAEKKKEKVAEMIATAPTAEQIRLLNVLQMRGDLDAIEVHSILPIFFSNYQAMRVLGTISKQNGINLTLPVNLDCRAMFSNIDKATDYLLKAADEIIKTKGNRNILYEGFFMINEKDPVTCLDPHFMAIIEPLDNVPLLSDCKAEKTELTPVEQAQLEWYYRDADKSNVNKLIAHTEKVMTEHPEFTPLLKYTPYAEYVDIVTQARAEGEEQ
jgi:hypothetical protein